jgi:ParB-like chromosome segregation protein Spo0J
MHYKKIMSSMELYGNITVGLVAKVKKTFYILDGKHRFEGCKVTGIPFEFKLIELDSTNDIVKIMASLNSTGVVPQPIPK